jgi:hypothetical protein
VSVFRSPNVSECYVTLARNVSNSNFCWRFFQDFAPCSLHNSFF